MNRKYVKIEPANILIRTFLEQIHEYVFSKNHLFRCKDNTHLKNIINGSFKLLDMDLEVIEQDKYWIFTGDIEELNRLDEAFIMFKPLFRHHSKDYSGCHQTDDDFLRLEASFEES